MIVLCMGTETQSVTLLFRHCAETFFLFEAL